jgi:hypothetical protein
MHYGRPAKRPNPTPTALPIGVCRWDAKTKIWRRVAELPLPEKRKMARQERVAVAMLRSGRAFTPSKRHNKSHPRALREADGEPTRESVKASRLARVGQTPVIRRAFLWA